MYEKIQTKKDYLTEYNRGYFFGSVVLIKEGLLGFNTLTPSVDLSFSEASSPQTQVVYDLFALAPSAGWHNNDKTIQWPSAIGNPEGACLYNKMFLEDNTYQNVLFTHPKFVNGGFMHGAFKNIIVPPASEKPTLRAVFDLTKDANPSDGVTFSASVQENGQWISLFSQTKKYTGSLQSAQADLSRFAGKTITLYINADAGPTPNFDWAAWKEIKIEKTIGSQQNILPTGAADSISLDNHTVSGWAKDENVLNGNVTVNFYIDNTYIGNIVANTSRPDVGGNYGFTWSIPQAYRTGEHSLKVAAKDLNNGQEKELLYSPTTYNYTTGVSMGPVTLLYSDAQMPVTMDSSMATIGSSPAQTQFFSTYAAEIAKFEGNLYANQPFQKLVWKKNVKDYVSTGNLFTAYACTKVWIQNIYQESDNFWLSFPHIEKFKQCENYDANTEQYSIGLAVSTNKGESWKLLGEIIKAKVDTDNPGNLGGTPLLLAGNYFYAYFSENTTTDKNAKYGAVARASISDVVSNAKQGRVTSWKKYNAGSWAQDGLTGVGSRLDKIVDTHTDAAVSVNTGKYLMIQGSANGLVKLIQSSDGLSWSEIATIDNRQEEGKWTVYSTIVNENVSSNKDSLKVGNTFFVLWPRKQGSQPNVDDLYMRRITLRQYGNPGSGPTSPPAPSPSPTPAPSPSPSPITYEKLLICPSSTSVKVGGSIQLQARIYRESSASKLKQVSCNTPYTDDGISQSIAWRTSSSRIFTVSGNQETAQGRAVRVGSVTVKASYGTMTASSQITVNR